MFRLDRFLTLGLFRPLMRLKLTKKKAGIPILMYHSISDDLQPGVHPYFRTTTSPSTFRRHMAFLKRNGYSVLTLKEAVGLLNSGYGNNQKIAVLTFDDGYEDFYTEAFPTLKAHGYSCNVFLPTAYVDNQDWAFKGKRCLSWDKVKELHSDGIAFGSHTVSHPKMATLAVDDIRKELELSKERIEIQLCTSTESFSYPFAFPEQNIAFVDTLKQLLYNIGYRYGVTTKIGLFDGSDNQLFLRRIPVNELDDLDLFKAKLCGAYNWMHTIQKISKYLKMVHKHS